MSDTRPPLLSLYWFLPCCFVLFCFCLDSAVRVTCLLQFCCTLEESVIHFPPFSVFVNQCIPSVFITLPLWFYHHENKLKLAESWVVFLLEGVCTVPAQRATAWPSDWPPCYGWPCFAVDTSVPMTMRSSGQGSLESPLAPTKMLLCCLGWSRAGRETAKVIVLRSVFVIRAARPHGSRSFWKVWETFWSFVTPAISEIRTRITWARGF